MAMGRSEAVQGDLMATWSEMPRSPGTPSTIAFRTCFGTPGSTRSWRRCAIRTTRRGWGAVAAAGALFPHAHDRLLRGDRQRAGDRVAVRRLVSLRDFLRLSNREKVPDHSWLSRTRSRLPHEAHETVFGWVLKLVAERGLVKGERIGVDGSTMEANAALRTIVRRDSGESYRAMLTKMAQESGIETPTARIWPASTASGRARRCRTPTGKARPTRTPGSRR